MEEASLPPYGCTPLISVVHPKKVFNLFLHTDLKESISNARKFCGMWVRCSFLSWVHYSNALLHILSQIEQQLFCIYMFFLCYQTKIVGKWQSYVLETIKIMFHSKVMMISNSQLSHQFLYIELQPVEELVFFNKSMTKI